MRTLKARNTLGEVIEVDCDLLVPFLQDVRTGNGYKWMSNGLAYRTAAALGLVQTYDGETTLRPQAEDFLATVASYPFEPAPVPKLPDCKECGGKGKKQLFVSEFDCERCEGKGVVEVVEVAEKDRYAFYEQIDVRIQQGPLYWNEPYGHSEQLHRRMTLPKHRLSAYFNDDGTPKLGTMVTYGVSATNMLGQEIVKTGVNFEQARARMQTYDPQVISRPSPSDLYVERDGT
jgi:hypothetical protein